MADEDLVAATVELEPETPPDRPALVVDHRPHVRHLVQLAAGEHAVGAGGEEGAPAREVLRSTRACRARRHRRVGLGLEPDGVRVRLDEVAQGRRDRRRRRRPGEPERVENALLQRLLPACRRAARDDLAEQREREVRVVPPPAGREHELGVGRARPGAPRGVGASIVSQISPGGSRWRPGRMREHLADRRARGRLGDVPRSGASSDELTPVAELQHAGGGKGLRDRADAVGVSGVASRSPSTSASPSACSQRTSSPRKTVALTDGSRCSAGRRAGGARAARGARQARTRGSERRGTARARDRCPRRRRRGA